MNPYDHIKTENYWQKKWEEDFTYRTDTHSSKPTFFGLIEFPYPSGAGLHVGHVRSYTGMDVIVRKRRMSGFETLFPIGWDAFGLPAENYAIKTGIHPSITTRENINTFRTQLKSCGFSFDWDREVDTTDPEYYKWTQWIFLKLYENGLAYKKEMPVNWCPKDKCVLANEEVLEGKCERCGAQTEKRNKEQWMLAITKYAERLDKDLDDTTFLERIKIQQRNWIGMSEGSEIDFKVVMQTTAEQTQIDANKNTNLKKKVLVIHGFDGSSKGSWKPWIKTELEKDDYEVIIPDLPNAGHPKFEELMPFLSDITNSFTNEDIVIGHSMGGYLALKLAEKQIFKKILLIAPCIDDVSLYDYEGWQKENPNDDYTSLKKMIEENPVDYSLITTKDKRALFSENDPSIPFAVKNTLPKDWIIKTVESEGHFPEKEHPSIIEALDDSFTVYTTRADTLFGCTYCVLAPEHNLVKQLLTNGQIKNKEEVEKYIAEAIQKIDMDRSAEGKEKTGVKLEGVMAINPANKKEVPIFIADYVLATYGTGAIMAVPAHDERDGEFASKYNILIKEVVLAQTNAEHTQTNAEKILNLPFVGDGILVNSGEFDGLTSEEARIKITEEVGGKLVKKSKLRDWVFARQRYWGEPIPLVYDKAGKMYPVAMSELPVTLPQVEKYEPTDNGESPLSHVTDWVNVKGKLDESGYFHTDENGETFRRETDTMPQWAGSSWYFMRYIDPRNDTSLGEKEMLMKWLPVTWYNGGMEHTTLHLLYSRFWYKFLFDIGLTPTSEPYMKRTSQGMILGTGGVKMSKSLGNVINPDIIVKKFGADTLRMYEMFIGPFDQAVAWDDKSVIGIRRFVDRLYTLRAKVAPSENSLSIIHKTIKKVGEDIDVMAFNTAISSLMICLNEFEKETSVPLNDFKSFLKLVAPFAPFITEELWKELGETSSIHKESWPEFDESKLIDNNVTYVLQVNGKLRGEVTLSRDTSKEDVLNAVKTLEGYLKYVGEAVPKQQIFVPGKLVNIVI